MAGDSRLFQTVMVHQVENVTGKSCDVRSLRAGQDMAAVATRIGAEDTVMLLKCFQ
jgi:hypothetical protein